jgi:hypothetical protein
MQTLSDREAPIPAIRPDRNGTVRPDAQETFLDTPADRRLGQKSSHPRLDMPTPLHVNSSRSSFASVRSAVSKPSVNQP